MEKDRVSIVIPTYNTGHFVGGAIDSALNQTYRNIEVVVVDDGSEDETRQILEPYIRSKKIVFIYQPNRGLSAARNIGIRAARGEFIAFLDSDDLFLPKKVENQVATLMDNPDFDICYSDILHFTDAVPRKYYHHRYHEIYQTGNLLRQFLKKNFINPLSVVARRSAFERYGFFDENLRRSEDWDLWLRWAYGGVKFYYLDKILGHYRIRSFDNLTSIQSEPKMKRESIHLFTNFFRGLNDVERKNYNCKSILFDLERKAAAAHLLIADKKTALQYLRKSMAYKPFAPLTWVFYGMIALLPTAPLRSISVVLRRIKHRLLLSSYQLVSSDEFVMVHKNS